MIATHHGASVHRRFLLAHACAALPHLSALFYPPGERPVVAHPRSSPSSDTIRQVARMHLAIRDAERHAKKLLTVSTARARRNDVRARRRRPVVRLHQPELARILSVNEHAKGMK
jgi:hypothetical protein